MELPALPRRNTLFLIVAGFFALTFLIYAWGLSNPFVRWDDGLLVYENPAVRSFAFQNLKYIFTHYDPELYIPVTFLTYQFDYLIGGGSTVPFHLGNLLLHTGNALLAGWLAFLLSRKGWIGIALGVIFAVHPLHTEAVMWVSARKDVLSAFGFLLSLILFLYWRERGGRVLYCGSIAVFVVGLLAKVMIIPLPVILFLFDLRDRRPISREMFTEKIPYFVAAFLLGVIAIFGKTGVLQSSSLSDKILMAFMSSAFYFKQILLPTHLSLLYPYIKPITITSPDFFVPILIVLVITGGAVMSFRRTREPLTWIAFFFLLVGPSFVNFAKGDMDTYFASDRYVYLGSFGVLFLVFLALDRAREKFRVSHEALIGVVGLLVLVAGIKAHAQSKVWNDSESLFQNVIALYPDASHVAYNNIANVKRLAGDMPGAIEAYESALKIRRHPMILSNLGATYRKLGRREEALMNIERALEMDPKSKDALFGRALLYADEGRYDDAVAYYQRAIETDPQYEQAYTNMGAAFIAVGKIPEAIAAYRKALAVNPYFPDARYNLAVALTESGDLPGAAAEYEQVTKLVPAFIPARLNLGLLYAKTGKTDEAKRQFQIILQLSPQNAAAQQLLRQLGGQ